MRIVSRVAALAGVLVLGMVSSVTAQCPPCNNCVGDCPTQSGVQDNDVLTVAEIIKGVVDLSACPKANAPNASAQCNGVVNVADLILASENYEAGNCAAGPEGTTSEGATLILGNATTCRNQQGTLTFSVDTAGGVMVDPAAVQAILAWPTDVVSVADCTMLASLEADDWYLSDRVTSNLCDYVVAFNRAGPRSITDEGDPVVLLNCDYVVKSNAPLGTHQVTISSGLAANLDGQAMSTTLDHGSITVCN